MGPGYYKLINEWDGRISPKNVPFGSNNPRQLDNRPTGVIENPAPNQYKPK